MDNRLFNRCLSMLLALVMVFSMAPVQIFATEDAGEENNAVEPIAGEGTIVVENNVAKLDGVEVSMDNGGVVSQADAGIQLTVASGSVAKESVITFNNTNEYAVKVLFTYEASEVAESDVFTDDAGAIEKVIPQTGKIEFRIKMY